MHIKLNKMSLFSLKSGKRQVHPLLLFLINSETKDLVWTTRQGEVETKKKVISTCIKHDTVFKWVMISPENSYT